MRSTSLVALLIALPALAACPKDVPLPADGAIRAARLETVLTVRDHRFASPPGAGLGRSLLAPAMDPAIAKTYGFQPPVAPAELPAFNRVFMDAMVSSGIAKKADAAFLSTVAGKLPFTVSKEEADPDAIVDLELTEKRMIPPTPEAPGRIELRVMLRLSAVGVGESAFEREETLLRDAPELGTDSARWLEDSAKVTAALTAASEDGARAAAGWLVEATIAKAPPATP